ncbi:MAG: SDR family NAD(P)-dependent oxidoreductase, partial [Acidimicrobiia bacterium]|nr:SDR family NAD(P)-dependent oxidoreductase [Acidimicrobiia bacterium]
MTSLAGRSAIVTGGGTGIGAACATRLAADGMDVTICGRRENLLTEVADRIAATGAPGRVRAQVTDVP